MKWKLAAALAAGALALQAAEGGVRTAARQSFEMSSTERFHFPPDGLIRLEHSYGYLTVEGWDEPEVEVIVTKSTDRFEEPEWKEKAERLFDQVRVTTERRSEKELAISTALPRRTLFLVTSVLPSGRVILTTPVPPNNKRGITVEYKVRAPRNSRLIVHHDNGYVSVSELTGDIQVDSHTGDMIVTLPDPGPYAIDARTRLGRIDSDIRCKNTNPLLVGGRLICGDPASAARVHLRMGRGSIEIQTSRP